ncbi:TMEM165/GDT1 family protein [Nocardioides jishulii]|uniref:GDT1 family protein n=1 Tax=Nocardioides jishulii TaxID=2575440 RepID=A0A4U2YSQ2_9ACTN|nr:TMEM165/GDT1 family protein [Nocardioides jishulii]QCX26185.1 TMEM165/GDT1 family protein [Nocardioides jishulii]TKI64014.1 TMEM165/GDT1 family protein [Nocardioides jishulii]
MDIAIIALAFAAIFVVELPDKTFIATLVLSTRFRPLLVWIGVGLAFAVQTGIAVALGKAAAFLPADLVQGAAALMFLIGALLLLREARGADAAETETEDEFAEKAAARGEVHGAKVILTSFLVLFAAEWGDLSQLLTLSLVAKYDDPVSVFLGAWAALLTVSGLAVIVGRVLLAKVKLSVLHYVGATVCFGLALFTAYEVFLA